MQPDKIKLLTPQQVAALGPAKVAALADVCVEWGPLSDADRSACAGDLEPLALAPADQPEEGRGRHQLLGLTCRRPRTRAAADKRDRRAAGAGRQGIRWSRRHRSAFAISLGVFRSEDAARNRARGELARRVKRREGRAAQQSVQQTVLVVRDPTAPAMARLKELQSEFPGQRTQDRRVRQAA